MDSVRHIRMDHGDFIYGMEVVFTIIFSIEYALRVSCLRRPREYICSAMGIVDISSIVPTFISTCVDLPICAVSVDMLLEVRELTPAPYLHLM